MIRSSMQIVEVREIACQLSWVFKNDLVELAITQRGAHMAPVTFYRNEKQPVRPYYISPLYADSSSGGDHPEVMRGDFLCLPFGSNQMPYNGERHPSHGETARSLWSLTGQDREGLVTTIALEIIPKVRAGKVTRELALRDGHNVVYDRTVIEGYVGKTTMAHHAILDLPRKERALLVSSSQFGIGMTCPYPFSDPSKAEYQALEIGAKFTDLSSVPSMFKTPQCVDCSAFPCRRGYTDLLQTVDDPNGKNPAWVAAVNIETQYLWFALKDPAVLPGRIMWMENHGRHSQPWNGAINCLGIEDGCMFFDKGIAESCTDNAITAEGFPTCHELREDQPFTVNYVQGVSKIPEGFGYVRRAEFRPEGVVFTSEDGQEVYVHVHHQFVYSGSFEGSNR